MKKLFSKRSGFTLVEIIIAFGIFAIMASMIVQVMNLMVRQKVRNRNFEDKLAAQEKEFIARGKNYSYDPSQKEADPLSLQFKDNSGTDLIGMNLDFQLKNWDADNPRNLVNYFVGDLDYDAELSFTEKKDDDDDDDDEKNKGGSSQMSRFDTRITGTKGIKSVKIAIQKTDTCTYTVSVAIDESGVDNTIQGHQQISLFFAKGTSEATPINVVSVNDGTKDQSKLAQVKACGNNGVNIHCVTDWSGKGEFSNPTVFTVKLAEDVEPNELGFGQGKDIDGSDITSGITYKTFKTYDETGNVEDEYVNIFGAYEKASSKPAKGDKEPDEGTEE